MGKSEEAPKGPDWEKLQKKMSEFAKQNADLFKEAFAFNKESFSKGQEFVDAIQNFGMDAMGNLNTQADEFAKTTADRVGALDQAGQQWGKQAADIYGKTSATADKAVSTLTPGMTNAADTGNQLLDSYQQQGIPFQDQYISKLAGWDTTGRREDRAAQAVNDIAMTTEAARESELRRLESYGIDPSQTRSAALDSRLQTANAIAKAVASNTARQAVENEGITYGKTASDMYEARRTGGLESITNAAQTGKAISDISRAPGNDYMDTLAKLGQYGINVGQLEQQGGAAEYDMRSDAAKFGERGTQNAATQQNAVNQFGLDIYDQQAQGVKQGAEIINSGYQTSAQINQNDIARVQANNENSLGSQLGTLAGIAAPFVLGPAGAAVGTALGTAMGVPAATAATAAASGVPAAGTNLLNTLGKGGPVKRSASPSKGAIPDDVPAMVDAGEYVFDRDTARWFGEKHLRNMQKQAKQGLGIPEGARA